MAGIAIFLILTALSEKPKKTLILLSIIPVSCVLPLGIRLIINTSLILGDIVGLVVLSGISVNNSIYIGESKKSKHSLQITRKNQKHSGNITNNNYQQYPTLYFL